MVQKVNFNNLTGDTLTVGNTVITGTGVTVSGSPLAGGATQYANTSQLPKQDLTFGEFALIGNTLFITNGVGWYSVGVINQSPSLSISVSDISLGVSGNTINFTYTATDPDGPTPTVTASLVGANSSQANVNLYTSNSTVTVENLSATEFSANIVLTATDGIDQTFGTVTLTVAYIYESWAEIILSIGTSSTNGLDNDTFIDRSTNALTVTPSGTPIQTAFHPYLDNWSVEFLSNDMFTIPNDTGFDLSGSGDFTVESWIYRTGDNNQYAEWIVGKRATGSPYTFSWYIGIGTGNKFFIASNTGSLLGTTVFELNRWYHVAAVRESGTTKVYVDGVLENTGSVTISEVDTPLTVGNYTVDSPEFNGFISNLRIVKGTAVYTSAFTPPTEKLTAVSGTSLLTCQSNRFIDNSTNSHTITVGGTPEVSAFNPFGQGSEYAVGENKGSVYLNGSSYMTLATSPFHMDQSDFTAECWIYPTVLGRYIMGIWSSTSASNQSWSFRTFSGGNINSEIDPGDVQIATSSAGIIKLNQWHHVALTRSGGDFRIFVNGDVVASGSSPGFNMAEGGGFMGIGAVQGLTGSPFTGYISDVYIRKGAAKYTSAFTTPTAPVQNTNATLYLPMDNAGIFDKTGNHTLTTVGNASTSTTQTKFATTAMYFDGTGDFARITNMSSFGTNNFTVEGWIYNLSGGVSRNIADARTGSSWAIQAVSNEYKVYDEVTASYIHTTTGSFETNNLNSWIHIAWCRSGSTSRFFINGTQVGSDVSNSSNYQNTSLRIGSRYSEDQQYFQGYIENLQILNGIAKYTSNFTAPTQTQGRNYQAES